MTEINETPKPEEGSVAYASIEGYGRNYFSQDDLPLVKAAAGCEDWEAGYFETDALRIRTAYESRIHHADVVKRRIVLEAVREAKRKGYIAFDNDSVEILRSLVDAAEETVEKGCLLVCRGSEIICGRTVLGDIASVELSIDYTDEEAVSVSVGQAHGHANFIKAYEQLLAEKMIPLSTTRPDYSSSPTPTLEDLLAHIAEPEFLMGLTMACDGRGYLIVRPGRFLNHFAKWRMMIKEEITRYLKMQEEIRFKSEDEALALTTKFANKVGLTIISGVLGEQGLVFK